MSHIYIYIYVYIHVYICIDIYVGERYTYVGACTYVYMTSLHM